MYSAIRDRPTHTCPCRHCASNGATWRLRMLRSTRCVVLGFTEKCETRRKEGTLLTAEMRGRASGDQGECLIKSSNIPEVGAVSTVELQVAEHRRDNARPTPQRHRTRLPQGLTQGTRIPALESPRQLPLLQGQSTASPPQAGTTAYDADHLQIG